MTKPLRTPSPQIGPALLRAAIEILDTEGPDGFTVRAIAERAGVAPMAIYNHFDGVGGVLEALWIQGFEMLHDAISVSTNDPVADLLSAGRGYRSFALANPGLYTVMFLHRFHSFQPSVDSTQVAVRAYQSLVETVERCRALHLFPGASASDAAHVIWSACHGFVSLELLGIDFSADRDKAYATLLETLRDGFR